MRVGGRLLLFGGASVALHLGAVVTTDILLPSQAGSRRAPAELLELRLVDVEAATRGVAPALAAGAAQRISSERDASGAAVRRTPASKSPGMPAKRATVARRPRARPRTTADPPASPALVALAGTGEAAPAQRVERPSETEQVRGDDQAAARQPGLAMVGVEQGSSAERAHLGAAAGAGPSAGALPATVAAGPAGAAVHGSGDPSGDVADSSATSACWAAVGEELIARARRAPLFLRRRALDGKVRLRFRLGPLGSATNVRVESLEGPPLLAEAARVLLEEPFGRRCPGEGLLPVSFGRD